MAKNLVEIIVTAEDKASGALRGIGGALGNVGRVATGAVVGGIGALVGGFALAGGAAISMNAELESSTLQFETLMGDSDRAAAHVRGLFDFAAKTPFETGPIIEASRVMQVFGGDALNTEDNLTRIGDTAAAVGAPIEDIGFWVGRAYAAIQGGQPFGEAAQNLMQMGAVSPDVVAEMNKLAEGGASADEVFGVLQGHMDGFSGAMEKQAGTWGGLKATLSDTLNMMAANTMKPFFDTAKEGLAGLAEWLNSPGVQDGIATIAEGLRTAGDVVKSFVGNLQEGMSPIDAFIEAIWDIAPQPVLDALVNFRDNILPGLMTAFHGIVDPIVSWVQNNVQLKDVLIALGAIILATVIPAVVGMVLSMAPILLTIGAVIAVVALLRNAWENNWGGIQEKVQAVWGAVQPVLQMVWEWLKVKVPEGLEALRSFWVDTAWPAIQGVVEWAWPILSAIFQALIDIIKNVIIPTVQDIYRFWVETAWPAISAALREAWENVIKPAFEALKDFIINTLMPAVRDLATKWRDEWWPAIKVAVQEAWDFIKPIWESLKTFALETIPNAISSMRDKFDEIMGNIKAAIQPVRDIWDGLVGAITGFWDWLKGKIFDFQINLPDLPDWAVPGSPLPIHTAWKQFADDMPRIAADLTTGPIGTGEAGRGPSPVAGGGQTTVVNIDARGAQRGVERDLRAMVEDVLRQYGVRADVRMRTT